MTDPVEVRLEFEVTDGDTAAALGSGSLAVLGTPRVLAWCEAATCASLEPVLEPGSTSVGTRVALEHLAASPVGARVVVTATPVHVDGRLHRFAVGVQAMDREGPGRLLATGEITRVVVDIERFLSRR